MCDIDHFKQINDTYGHPAGDVVLVEAARRMQSTLRTYDALGRFGGEEFLIVCPGTDLAGVQALGERIRHAMLAEPVQTGRMAIEVQVSLGVTAHCFDTSLTRDQMISNVDGALYAAKRNGRNRVEAAVQPAAS